MKFESGTLRPSGRFYFDDDHPEEGWVEIQLLSGKDLDEINKECTIKQKPEYRRNQRYEVPPKMNEELQSEMMWDKMITAWDNVELDGKQLECNLENKKYMMRNSVVMARTVGNGVEALSIDAKAGERLVKNLESSPLA